VYKRQTLDHFKLNKRSTAPANFMHPVYNKRNITLLVIVLLLVLFQGLGWYYYLATGLSIALFYIPIHDGYYYLTRNDWKSKSYKGFWMGVDSDPSSKFAKVMNEPTMRILLFVLAVFCIIFILTYEPFM
jgi:hypothetical protein